MRAQLEKKVAQKEKEKKEEHLRTLAQKAREERAGIRTGMAGGMCNSFILCCRIIINFKITITNFDLYLPEKDDDAKERDQLRHERHKDRQRERNIQRAAPDKRYLHYFVCQQV